MVLAASALVMLASALPLAAQPASEREVQVEAAFLVNFVRYADWPAWRFDNPASPYVVAVVGTPAVANEIAAVAAAAGNIQGRRIEVRRVEFPRHRDAATRKAVAAQLCASHVVFVQASGKAMPGDVLPMVAASPVLTVSDIPGFAGRGGMLGLVREGPHFGIEANPAAIRAAGVSVSAKVLKLAHIRRSTP